DPRFQKSARFLADYAIEDIRLNPKHLARLVESFRPIKDALLDPLKRTFEDKDRVQTDRYTALSFITSYAANQPNELAELFLEAESNAAGQILAVLLPPAPELVPMTKRELAKQTSSAPYEEKDRLARRQAHAAAALLKFGETEHVWPLFRHSEDPS